MTLSLLGVARYAASRYSLSQYGKSVGSRKNGPPGQHKRMRLPDGRELSGEMRRWLEGELGGQKNTLNQALG